MAPKTVRWGMMATGGIVQTFTKDILVDPETRGVDDIKHVVTAVASSSSKDSAEKFIKNCVEGKQGDTQCTAYGSYMELVQDSNVDIVYIGTPHSHHYQNCRLALEHDKPILCEKALTVNAEQAKILFDEAKKRNLFFMEAVWTRYFPLSIEVRRLIQDGKIGEVIRVQSDMSIGAIPEEAFDLSHRMVNKDLAGGALLDLGIYALTWQFQTLYHTLPKEKRKAPRVVGTVVTPEPRTGADEATSMLLEFPVSTPSGKRNAHGIATTAFRAHFDNEVDQVSATPAVRIFGEEGEIQVFGPIYRPSRYRITFRDPEERIQDFSFDFPGDIHGMAWEGDEAARCWMEGKLESESMGWEESLAIMQTMDEVRKQGGLTYPGNIESTEYPIDLAARG
ncbi:hypothetical protein LTR70_003551 [Exophiala xenobiotica]|uniref:D-xylose 1-dehydrogenase (NADP(+), D-xylono-1,5-lactone-forming) n=1 Tax=Lithohypha guttulata TaxID=1690604 RepID=A0ABR0KFV7_9EURO|nr:hypothetical protein LTR24_003099 [Lithohypha guttulata]KAK5322930.1 hypothetical protein LTR70_003551 [Exophiala xenobiotica]